MRKIILLIFFMSFLCQSYSQFEAGKQIFKSPNLDSARKKIKSVAILPFTVVLAYKKMPKGMTEEIIKSEEEKSRTEYQEGLYTYLLRKQQDFTVTVQNPDRTNSLLKKAGIFKAEDLDLLLPDSIAKLLEVDAVIKSHWNYTKTSSEGGAIARAALLGMSSNTGTGTMTLQLYNGVDGELLWRFFKEMNESMGSDANDTMERMMKKLGRNFPLEKD